MFPPWSIHSIIFSVLIFTFTWPGELLPFGFEALVSSLLWCCHQRLTTGSGRSLIWTISTSLLTSGWVPVGHTPFAICLLLQLSFWILLLLYHAELLVIASLHLAASVPLHINTYRVDGWPQHSGWWRDEPGRTSDLIRWVGKVKMGVGIFVLGHQL